MPEAIDELTPANTLAGKADKVESI